MSENDIQPHRGWTLRTEVYEDDDQFDRLWSEAEHPLFGKRILQVSDFTFSWTQERFNWLVENDFPMPPGRGPWSNSEIDRRIADAASAKRSDGQARTESPARRSD